MKFDEVFVKLKEIENPGHPYDFVKVWVAGSGVGVTKKMMRSQKMGNLGQRIDECILPSHPLQVCCCTESWKGCRHVAQLPSSDIKNLNIFF